MFRGHTVGFLMCVFLLGVIGVGCEKYKDGGSVSKAPENILNRWELVGVWFNAIYKPATRLDLVNGSIESLYWEVYCVDDKGDNAGEYTSIIEKEDGSITKEAGLPWKLSEDYQYLTLSAENHPLKLFGIDTSSADQKFKIIKLKYNKAKHVGELIYARTYGNWTYKFVFRPD